MLVNFHKGWSFLTHFRLLPESIFLLSYKQTIDHILQWWDCSRGFSQSSPFLTTTVFSCLASQHLFSKIKSFSLQRSFLPRQCLSMNPTRSQMTQTRSRTAVVRSDNTKGCFVRWQSHSQTLRTRSGEAAKERLSLRPYNVITTAMLV